MHSTSIVLRLEGKNGAQASKLLLAPRASAQTTTPGYLARADSYMGRFTIAVWWFSGYKEYGGDFESRALLQLKY